MTVQAAVGSSVLATAVGLGATGGGGDPAVLAEQIRQPLALTGASNTVLLVTLAVLLILAGILLKGLSRRHQAATVVGVSGSGPPLTR